MIVSRVFVRPLQRVIVKPDTLLNVCTAVSKCIVHVVLRCTARYILHLLWFFCSCLRSEIVWTCWELLCSIQQSLRIRANRNRELYVFVLIFIYLVFVQNITTLWRSKPFWFCAKTIWCWTHMHMYYTTCLRHHILHNIIDNRTITCSPHVHARRSIGPGRTTTRHNRSIATACHIISSYMPMGFVGCRTCEHRAPSPSRNWYTLLPYSDSPHGCTMYAHTCMNMHIHTNTHTLTHTQNASAVRGQSAFPAANTGRSCGVRLERTAILYFVIIPSMPGPTRPASDIQAIQPASGSTVRASTLPCAAARAAIRTIT